MHADLETTELFGNVKLQQEPVLAIIMSLIIHVGGTVVYFWPVWKIISMPMFWVQTGFWMPIWAFGNVDLYQQVKIWHYIEKDEYLGLVFSCQTQDVYFAWCIMGLCLTFKQVTHWIMKLYLHKMYINIDTVYFLNFVFQSMVYIEVHTGESYMTRSMCQCRLRNPSCWSVCIDRFDF